MLIKDTLQLEEVSMKIIVTNPNSAYCGAIGTGRRLTDSWRVNLPGTVPLFFRPDEVERLMEQSKSEASLQPQETSKPG